MLSTQPRLCCRRLSRATAALALLLLCLHWAHGAGVLLLFADSSSPRQASLPTSYFVLVHSRLLVSPQFGRRRAASRQSQEVLVFVTATTPSPSRERFGHDEYLGRVLSVLPSLRLRVFPSTARTPKRPFGDLPVWRAWAVRNSRHRTGKQRKKGNRGCTIGAAEA